MSETLTRRGTFAKTAKRQREITEATLQLVDQSGHGVVTLSTVARYMGVPVPTIQYHFPTRAHLLVAALELIDEVNGLEANVQSDTPRTEPLITVAIRAISRVTTAHPERLALISYLRGEASSKDHLAYAYFKDSYAKQIDGFAAVIRGMQRDGIAHPDLNPEHVARQAIAAWNGLQMQWLVDPAFDYASVAEEMVRHLTRQDIMEARQAVADFMQSM